MLNIGDQVILNSSKPHIVSHNGRRAVIMGRGVQEFFVYLESINEKGWTVRNKIRVDDEDVIVLPTYEQLEAKIAFLRGELQTIADGLKFLTPEEAANIALSSAFGRI